MSRRIKQNIWGNWNGYEGTRKVREFGTDDFDARLWEKGELDAIDAERAKETSRTILGAREPWPFPRSPLIVPARAVKPRQKRKAKNLPDALL